MKAEYNLIDEQRGVALLLVVICVAALLAFSAMAIDSGMVLSRRMQLELILDASTLRGAQAFYERLEKDKTAASHSEIESVVRSVASSHLSAIGYESTDISRFLANLTVHISETDDGGRRVEAKGELIEGLLLAPIVFAPLQTQRVAGASAALSGVPPVDPGKAFPNILLVTDTSCSMNEEDALPTSYQKDGKTISTRSRIGNLVSATQQVIALLPEGVTLGINSFDVGTRTVFYPHAMDAPGGPIRQQAQAAAISLMGNSTRCNTDLADAITYAEHTLQSFPRDPATGELRPTTVILISDGKPTHPRFNVESRHPQFPTNEILKPIVETMSNGACTYRDPTLIRPRWYAAEQSSFQAAEWFRSRTNTPILSLAFGATEDNARLMRSIANSSAPKSQLASLICRPVGSADPLLDLGQHPKGPQGQYHAVVNDFASSLREVLTSLVEREGSKPRRVHHSLVD